MFFTNVPQLPRMIDRAQLLTNLRLPPKNPDFPHPSLLHAICAAAAPYTAWVKSAPPESATDIINQWIDRHGSVDGIDDFGLAQAELAYKTMRLATTRCISGPATVMLQSVQASVSPHSTHLAVAHSRLSSRICTSAKQ